MTLIEAINYFNDLLKQTDKKWEAKMYRGFLDVLSNLKSRGLTEQEVKSIESKLDELDLKSVYKGRKRHLRQKFSKFTTFLKKEFSLVPEGYYTQMGMIFGMIFGNAIGMSIGTAFGGGTGIAIGISMGTGIGMAIGIVYGAAKDKEAKKQDRILK